MINLIIAVIAILLSVAVAVFTLYAEDGQAVDPHVVDSYWWFGYM
jgi:hypothetical protein